VTGATVAALDVRLADLIGPPDAHGQACYWLALLGGPYHPAACRQVFARGFGEPSICPDWEAGARVRAAVLAGADGREGTE